MMVQIIGFYDTNDQEKREDFCMQKLQTLCGGLNIKRINQYKVFLTGLLNTFFHCLILITSEN